VSHGCRWCADGTSSRRTSALRSCCSQGTDWAVLAVLSTRPKVMSWRYVVHVVAGHCSFREVDSMTLTSQCAATTCTASPGPEG
jgi:hypothetical protein